MRKPHRRIVAGLVVALTATVLAACTSSSNASSNGDSSSGAGAGGGADSGLTITIGQQGAQTGAEVDASGVLDGAPYKVKWATFSGPTNVIAAFDAKGIDLGLLGDTSLILNQANSSVSWAKGDAPYQNVAIYGSIVADKYPTFVTLASKKSGITSGSDLKGKKWAYVPGGNTNLAYLLSLKAAGLTPTDIKPVILQDFTSIGNAVASGQVDVGSMPSANAQGAIAAGARVIYNGAQVGVPGINTWAAPKAVLADAGKAAAISDFLTRLVSFWDWYTKNPDKVQKVLEDSVKQSPEVAKYNSLAGQSRFFPIDDAYFTIEQPVSQTLADGGLIKKPVEVPLEYDTRFNDALAAASQKVGTSFASASLGK